MELLNFPGWDANQKNLTADQIDLSVDKFIVGKKVNDKRDGTQYQAFSISGDELKKAVGIDPATQPKVYKALLTQTGTNPPVATVLVNTLSGTPVWSRVSGGQYRLTLTGEFTSKTDLEFDDSSWDSPTITFYKKTITTDYIEILVSSGNMENIDAGNFIVDGIDDRITKQLITIEVYP